MEVIAEALPGRAVETIVTGDAATWIRAGDFVVGAVFVSPDNSVDEIAAAYAVLESDGIESPITKQELWNLVLFVRVPEGREDMARKIAQDLTCSRKVPYIDGDAVPRLIGPFSPSTTAGTPRLDNPIADALTTIATSAERTLLLSVLLGKDRRDREESERLLDVLGSGAVDG